MARQLQLEKRGTMTLHIAGTWKNVATKMVVATASVALLTACSSGGDSAGSSDSSAKGDSKATAAAPAASEQDLLLTNEVSGVTFDSAIDKNIMDAAAGPIAEGMQIEPASCSKLVDASTRVTDLAGTFAQFKEEKVAAGIALSKQTDIYQAYEDALDGCSDVKLSMDGAEAARKIAEEQGLPPEAQQLLDGVDMTSTYDVHFEKWEPQVNSNPEKLTGEETTGTAQVTGVSATVSSFRIMGIVNNVLIIVTTTPFADFTATENGAMIGQTENSDITPEAKEAAKKRAVEIFDAQAKKILAAS